MTAVGFGDCTQKIDFAVDLQGSLFWKKIGSKKHLPQATPKNLSPNIKNTSETSPLSRRPCSSL